MTTIETLKETYGKLMKLSDDAFKLLEEQDEKLNEIDKKTDEILGLLKKKA